MTQNNVAIVTGGSAGIGAEICRSMLEAGYEVVSMARRAADFSHPRLHNVQVDLLDADATAQAAALAAQVLPPRCPAVGLAVLARRAILPARASCMRQVVVAATTTTTPRHLLAA